MAKKETHTHKYLRVNLSPTTKTKVYRCTLPGCTHYTYPHLIKGRKCICNRCNKEFVIGREHQFMAKPHCSDCIKRKKPFIPDDNVLDLLNDTFDYGRE